MKNKEKEEIKKIKEKSKGFFGEFKTFIQRGKCYGFSCRCCYRYSL